MLRSLPRKTDHRPLTTDHGSLRVENGQALWADTFDEKFIDIFAVEDSISEKIAAASAN
jgi:hypothetical protein